MFVCACDRARESVIQHVSVCARVRVRESLVQCFSVCAFFCSSQFEILGANVFYSLTVSGARRWTRACQLDIRTKVSGRVLHCGAWILTLQGEPVGQVNRDFTPISNLI